MKRLLALLLSLILMVSAVPATADDLDWLPFEATLCDIIFDEITPAELFEEDLHALIACFLLIEYSTAYDEDAADYVTTEGCYVGYLDEAYWCAFLNDTINTILSIVYAPGSEAEAAITASYGSEDALSLHAAQMADTVTEYREVTVGEMSVAFDAIIEILSDD